LRWGERSDEVNIAPLSALDRNTPFEFHRLPVRPRPLGGDIKRVGAPWSQTGRHEIAPRPILSRRHAIDSDDRVGRNTDTQHHIRVSEPDWPRGGWVA
jgi:hypothetical protein